MNNKQEVILEIGKTLHTAWDAGCTYGSGGDDSGHTSHVEAKALYDRIALLIWGEFPRYDIHSLFNLTMPIYDLSLSSIVKGKEALLAGLRRLWEDCDAEPKTSHISLEDLSRTDHHWWRAGRRERRRGKDRRDYSVLSRRSRHGSGRRQYDGNLIIDGNRRKVSVVPITESFRYSRRQGVDDRRKGKDRRAPQS